MKEVTKWDNNPRMMWVWDNGGEGDKIQRKVIYIIDSASTEHPVLALADDGYSITRWAHCAEIEEEEPKPKYRRMTNQELAWWLQDGIKEGKHREWKKRDDIFVRCFIYSYSEDKANGPIDKDILIREDGGEWHEPPVEVEE